MTALLITIAVFAVLLAAYAAILWFTREGGPADIVAFFDEGQGR